MHRTKSVDFQSTFRCIESAVYAPLPRHVQEEQLRIPFPSLLALFYIFLDEKNGMIYLFGALPPLPAP